ncbi:hypothetical protein [Hymenobacter sp. APR13]|uniref:hypothetical protein n=1 Tax=Hymenobacter sp. APR13 TaxID=1356852 RepID=UPI0004E076F7|nr:hypothetical protein [Hymenobacter sp. APR13]AII51178.1 hypothetical protein N008_04180 [Hymenobacter sp. APR13]
MLHCLLFEPYASAAAETRAEALQESLTGLGEGVLLLNLALDDELLDAVLLLPRGVAVLQLLPGGRHLSADHLTHGPWLLDGQPIPGFSGSDNPYQQLQRQRPALAAWLAGQPLLPTIAPDSIGAMAVFQELLHIESGLAEQLHKLPVEDRFQLVHQPQSVLRDFQQLPADKPQPLPADTLDAWATALLQPDEDDTSASGTDLPADDTDDLLTRKARQLWRWLGAEDVPADPPYGATAPPVAPDALADSQQEKARLEQIRQQIRAEVSEQTQALQTREAARDQTIAQLRQQLAEASAAAPETARLQAQLAAEAHEKAALEAAIQAARAESDARNRDLDARIQQLSQQLQQLQARPVAAPAPAPLPAAPAPARPVPPAAASTSALTSAPARAAAPAARPATRRPAPAPAPATWRLQWPRVALAGAVALLAGAGIWGAAQLPGLLRKPAAAPAAARPASRPEPDDNTEAAAPTLFDIQPDTIRLTAAEDAAVDSLAAAEELEQLAADPSGPASAAEVMDTLAAPPDDL